MSGTIEKAASWAEQISADNSHGYDQGSRWGPDYDCSSLVISAYRSAGVPLACTYTGNMRGDMMAHGFVDVTGSVSLTTGAEMQRGDVLLNERSHTAMYIGGGQIVHARGNELGGVTGGQSGDQTGGEICRQGYFNFPWDCVLRYVSTVDTGSSSEKPNTYTVQPGDMLGLIATRYGTTIAELVRLNGLSNPNLIYPGQVLVLKGRPPENPAIKTDGNTYTVQPGDSLWDIAARELGGGWRWREIHSLNVLTGNTIYPGQVLKLPEE